MYRLLEAAEETTEASIDPCSAIMPLDMADKLQEPQTNIDNNIIEATEKITKELKQMLFAKGEDLQDNVKDYMGLRTILTINNKPIISWKNCVRSSLDLLAFKAEYPELYGLFLKETNSRVFRLS
jgi:hypothetical protein